MYFKQNFKHCRHERRLTQEKLGEALGIKRSVICSYEDGRGTPSYTMLIKICDYFGHTIDDFLKAEPK